MEQDITKLLKEMKKADAPRVAKRCVRLQHSKAKQGLTDKQKYLRQLKGGFK